uniref:Uncharacterized protein n=1 Tax=Maylandia zebra TaxID=106582 RepID=A0A3P9C4X7_9CICH
MLFPSSLNERCCSLKLKPTFGNCFMIELKERESKGAEASYPLADVGHSLPAVSQAPGMKTDSILEADRAHGDGGQTVLEADRADGNGGEEAVLGSDRADGNGGEEAVLGSDRADGNGGEEAVLGSDRADGNGGGNASLEAGHAEGSGGVQEGVHGGGDAQQAARQMTDDVEVVVGDLKAAWPLQPQVKRRLDQATLTLKRKRDQARRTLKRRLDQTRRTLKRRLDQTRRTLMRTQRLDQATLMRTQRLDQTRMKQWLDQTRMKQWLDQARRMKQTLDQLNAGMLYKHSEMDLHTCFTSLGITLSEMKCRVASEAPHAIQTTDRSRMPQPLYHVMHTAPTC